MYKLLIADDDENICKGLGRCIPWGEHGIQVTGMVYDGEMALTAVKEEPPDIIILDINMPFMDGMELACIIREDYPDTKIILLTAYKEFQYAKRAVQLQVFEYLTKPFENQEVLAAVLRASGEIEREHRYRSKARQEIDRLREKYLEEVVLYGDVTDDVLAGCQFGSTTTYFQVAILYLRMIPGIKENERDLLINNEVALRMTAYKLREMSREASSSQYKLFVLNSRIVFIFEYEQPESVRQVQVKLQEILGRLEKEDQLFLIFGVGKVYQGSKKLPKSYQEASSALDQRFGYGNQGVIFCQDLHRNSESYEIEFTSVKKKLQQGVQQCSADKIQVELDELFAEISKVRHCNPSSLVFLLVEMLSYTYELVEDSKVYGEFLANSGKLLSNMLKTKNLRELKAYVDSCFAVLYVYLDAKCTTDLEQRVNQAMEYIREHHADPALSLNQVAEHVNLSVSYLGNSLKKYKHASYINLLNRIRIENAKKLLMRPDVKTYEVAFMSGFNSSQYFSSCFKKYTGMTPREYKEKREPSNSMLIINAIDLENGKVETLG